MLVMAATSRRITTKSFYEWPEVLRKEFSPVFDENNDHVVHAYCITCKANVQKIKQRYQGKLVEDVIKYGEQGIFIYYLLIVNFTGIYLDSHDSRRCFYENQT